MNNNDKSADTIPDEWKAWVFEDGRLTGIDLQEEIAYDIPVGYVWWADGPGPEDICLPLDDFLECIMRVNAAVRAEQEAAEQAVTQHLNGMLARQNHRLNHLLDTGREF